MKIGIDFDDVITKFTPTLMEWHHKKYGKLVAEDEILIWDWGLYWQVPREEAIRRADEFHETHKVEELPAIEKAIDSLKELMKNNEIFIITGRPIRFKHRVEEWIKHHVKASLQIIHAGEFHKGQAATKAEICKELKIPILIEDVRETAIECAEAGIKVLLFDKPWNKNFKHKNVIRVKNWPAALKELQTLSKS